RLLRFWLEDYIFATNYEGKKQHCSANFTFPSILPKWSYGGKVGVSANKRKIKRDTNKEKRRQRLAPLPPDRLARVPGSTEMAGQNKQSRALQNFANL
ncbi:MAG: hypothetical protein NZM41_07000, partial [Saprospiraceae bacterium]|nr:hypothetical protein [Saprospiraceae bacterium]